MANKRHSDSQDCIISVESRKGGVGKTTAALCLGRLLRQWGYAVLVLDLDVTGTDASDISKSPFWRDDLHVVSLEDSPLNLITLFDTRFLSGQAIPDFAVNDTTGDQLRIHTDKVNVIGSQIYRNHTENGNGETCIERPGILFDDLHTLWLLEFLKQLIHNFKHVVGNNKVAVVLDNSPGYVGISPAIHEWLTDLGPDQGKFLTVTSLDYQDLSACERGMTALHKLYSMKWQTSRLLLSAGKDDNLKVEKGQQGFFMRLATSSDQQESNLLAYYLRKDNSAQSQGQSFCENPQRYTGTVINRVPRAVKAGLLGYDFPPILSDGEGSLARSLNLQQGDWRRSMVSYDEYIENQFLLPSLSRKRFRSKHGVHRLIDTLEELEHSLMGGVNKDMLGFLSIEHENLDRLRGLLSRLDEVTTNARSTVSDVGLSHLSRLIHESWMPGRIIPDFRNSLTQLLREGEMPFFDMVPFKYDTGEVNEEALMFVTDLGKRMRKECERFLPETHLKEEARDLFTGTLSCLGGLSMTSPMWYSPLREEMASLFATVLSVELKHWSERESTHGYRSFQQFLAGESLKKSELEKELRHVEGFKILRRHMIMENDDVFERFYSACSSAQARLMDCVSDSQFLIRLLRHMVIGDVEERHLFPFVRGIAEDVIINKSLPHEQTESRMSKALHAAEYFREFEQVLTGVLSNWGLVENG